VPFGFHALSGLVSIQLAKPSFNQMSSHHSHRHEITNHWWAISCASTMPICFAASRGPSFRIGQEERFAVKNRGGVFHRAGGEVGNRTTSSFLNGYFTA
jgi:hypothetical protein